MEGRISLPPDGNGPVVFSKREILISGVHTGEFMGIPPTGKSVCVRCASFDRVINGKLVSGEVFMDMASLMVQLGVMPPPKFP